MPQSSATALPRSPFARLSMAGAWRSLQTAWQRRQDRAQLARLDAHILQDIGLDAEQALAEARKPFWQP